MNSEQKAEIMKEIINLLAKKECTVQDAEDILHGTKISICITAKVEELNY